MASGKKKTLGKKASKPRTALGNEKNASKITHKDVQIAFLLDGLPGVEKLDAAHPTAKRGYRRAVLLKALDLLKQQGQTAAALEEYVSEHYAVPHGRGRMRPAAGSERSYRAQQLGDNPAFLRLPLSSLNVKKGGELRVAFEADRIVVRRS